MILRPALLAVVLVAMVLAGCAETRSVMRYQADDAEVLVWPQPPEKPRYQYIGQLTGEENFNKQSKESSLGRKMLGWLVGLVSGKKTPVVLQRPQNGFVDNEGRIIVTDVSRAAIYVFDETQGSLDVWEMADDNTRFITPVGIVPAEEGQFLVVDADLGRVIRLDRDGKSLGGFGKGLLKRPTGLARDAETGRIYVADTHEHAIKIFDNDGNLLEKFGGKGDGDGQFNSPTYLAFANDRLYVTDTLNSRVQVFSASGEFVRKFGRRGLHVGDLPRPKGVAVDNDNNVYVVESYYDYLLIFNAQGEFLLPIGGTGKGIGQFYLPAGVWTDQRDRVFVADSFNGRIMIFQYMGDA